MSASGNHYEQDRKLRQWMALTGACSWEGNAVAYFKLSSEWMIVGKRAETGDRNVPVLQYRRIVVNWHFASNM
jgi:hypothetical protein